MLKVEKHWARIVYTHQSVMAVVLNVDFWDALCSFRIGGWAKLMPTCVTVYKWNSIQMDPRTGPFGSMCILSKLREDREM